MLVDIHKVSGSKGYYSYSALVDSGATFNFISQSVANRLRLEAVKAGRKRNRKKWAPLITTVNGELLRATAVVWQIVQMHNSTRMKQSQEINCIRANIAHYNIILSMAWLQKQNPDIHCDTGVWYWRTCTEAEDGPICQVSAGAFIATMRAEHMHGHELHFH